LKTSIPIENRQLLDALYRGNCDGVKEELEERGFDTEYLLFHHETGGDMKSFRNMKLDRKKREAAND
jgi:hypothetical protein